MVFLCKITLSVVHYWYMESATGEATVLFETQGIVVFIITTMPTQFELDICCQIWVTSE